MNGTQFRQIRRNLDYSQTELAQMLGVTRQTVWAWESGKAPLPKYAAIAISTFHPRLYTSSENLTVSNVEKSVV